MPLLHSRKLARAFLPAVICLTGLLLSGCDHAKDLVEQGKKQAEDIQKSIEGKTEEATSSKPGEASSSPAVPSATVAPPAAVQPQTPNPDQVLETFLNCPPNQRTDAMLHALGALPEDYRGRLKECILEKSLVTDGGLAEVAKFPNLTLVNLTDCNLVTDRGLAALKDLKKLEALILEHCGITDAGMSHIRGLTGLLVLNLNRTLITDAGIVQLAPLSQLKELYVSSTTITGNSFRKVSWAASLRVLTADFTSIGVELQVLKGYRNLEELSLYKAQVSDETVGTLKGFSKLRKLRLGDNKLSDVGARQLTGLTSMEDISLGLNPVTDKCLATFKVCKNLTKFGEGGTAISAAGRDYILKFAPQCTFDTK